MKKLYIAKGISAGVIASVLGLGWVEATIVIIALVIIGVHD